VNLAICKRVAIFHPGLNPAYRLSPDLDASLAKHATAESVATDRRRNMVNEDGGSVTKQD